MLVQADEARHDIHAGGIDLEVGALRSASGAQGQAGRPGAAHRLDAIACDDDVDRADRRRAGAVDEDGAADHERLERPAPLVGASSRGRRERLAFCGACACGVCGRGAVCAPPTSTAPVIKTETMAALLMDAP